MKLKVALRLLVILALGTAQGASAHHSVPVNFDQSREITIEGMLTEIAWRNPHAHFRIDVTNKDGSTVEWLVEMGAVNTMKRAGFPMDRFIVGERLSVIGWPGRRDRSVLLREAVLHDGTHLDPEMKAAAR